MLAGRMTTRLTLLKPQRVVDKFGSERVDYITTRRIHAERVKHAARNHDEVGEHFPNHSVEFNIRIQHPVQENWRAREWGGHLYTITAIIPNKPRGLQTLICERVNE